MKIKTAYFIESPLFEIMTEDGPASTFNLQIVAETEDGRKFTHNRTYEAWQKDDAEKFSQWIVNLGRINVELHWHEGTSWDHYAVPQTYEEEMAEHISYR